MTNNSIVEHDYTDNQIFSSQFIVGIHFIGKCPWFVQQMSIKQTSTYFTGIRFGNEACTQKKVGKSSAISNGKQFDTDPNRCSPARSDSVILIQLNYATSTNATWAHRTGNLLPNRYWYLVMLIAFIPRMFWAYRGELDFHRDYIRGWHQPQLNCF